MKTPIKEYQNKIKQKTKISKTKIKDNKFKKNIKVLCEDLIGEIWKIECTTW